jgi:hypothetical protein
MSLESPPANPHPPPTTILPLGEGESLEEVGPENRVHKNYNTTEYRIQNTEHRIQNPETHVHKTTYGPLIDTALCVMLLMRANPLLGQVGGGRALEIETFLGPVKWHRAVRLVWSPKNIGP